MYYCRTHQSQFLLGTVILVLLCSTIVVANNGSLVPTQKQLPVSEAHEEWLRLQRQQSPYVEDEDRVNVTSLKLVQVLFRHGGRTPIFSFPTDPNANFDYGVKGPGQLTKEGRRQAFELGQYLRDRYAGYFEPNYSFDEVYAQSSDIDRTIMTTELCLAGLFAPKPTNHRRRRWIFKDRHTKGLEASSQLEVFPVRTLLTPIDNKFGGRNRPVCQKQEELAKAAMNTPEMLKRMKEDAWMSTYLSEKTGLVDVDFDKMEHIANTLQLEDLYNLTLPEWTAKVYPEKLQEILRIFFTTNTSTPELKRFEVGPLMAQFVQNMEMRVSGRGETLGSSWTPADLRFYHFRPAKAYLFGGHDVTIASVLNALRLYDDEQPAFTSALILELHGPKSSSLEDDYIIKMFYKKTRSESITELDLQKCPTPCTFADFKESYANLILGDGQWEKECHI